MWLRSYLSSGILFICSLYGLHAQDCGTIPTESQVEYIDALGRMQTRELDFAQGIVDIPYQLHIVKRSDGSGSLEEQYLNEQLDQLNEIYLKSNIRFVENAEPNRINDDRYFTFRVYLEDSLALPHDVENVINIYCLEEIDGGYYGYTYHPDKSRKNRMFISRDGFENGSTLPHEMGHFFGLYHTHGKGIPSEKEKEPIARNIDVDQNGIVDCYETGDDLCDTPADPNLGLEEYRSYCLDNCLMADKIPAEIGGYYEPQITNLMCYNQHPNCRTELTREQLSRISHTARTERKKLIREQALRGKSISGSVRFFKDNGLPMPLSLDINLYRFVKEYKQGDQFAFEVENRSSTPLYISILNMDSKGALYNVFPMDGDAKFIFPNEKLKPVDGYITLDDAKGREYVCMLFSNHPLNNERILMKMKNSTGTFTQRLYALLGRQLLPLDHVKYESGTKINFDGRINEGEILPVMMEMKHR